MKIVDASLQDVREMREEVIKCRDESLGKNFNAERVVNLSHLIEFLADVISQAQPEDIISDKDYAKLGPRQLDEIADDQ